MALMKAADVHKERADVLMASTDTTQIGTGIIHAYRFKNTAGAVVSARAYFVLLNSGALRVIK